MLVEEAQWLGKQLCALDPNCYPMINIGSSTSTFREQVQPHIDKLVFKPVGERGNKVLHADIKNAEGVDLVGDLNDPRFIELLKEAGAKSILCSNLLEHLKAPQTTCIQLEKVVPPGGLIVVTVPYVYPYHTDPIDTKFRPSVSELCGLFSNCSLLRGEIIASSGSQAKTLCHKIQQGQLLYIFNTVKRWILPLHGINEWRKAVTDIPHLFKPYQITCIILIKKHE